ncbi:MAG: ATP-binding protein [Gammaproteobacteria bacterium]|nr:sensor histidine kinase [Gammaproteobacteria bacterium]
MRRVRSLRARLLLGALVWVACASLAGGYALSYAFRTAARDAFDAQLGSLVAVLIGLVDLDANGQLRLARPIGDPHFDQVYSGWYWMVIGPEAQLRSRSLWDLELEVPDITTTSAAPTISTARDPLGRELRVAVQRAVLPGSSAPLLFVVTGNAEALHVQYRRFDTILRIALSALGLGLLFAVLVQIRFGLRPLERLVREIEAIRSGKAERLSELETAELDSLVAEVNSLIDHNRRVVERARASASDLAHALKTPLAVMKSLEREEGPEAARERSEQLATMERIVTRHLARAAAAGPGRHSPVAITPIVEEIARGLTRVHADRVIVIQNEVPSSVNYPADRQDLEEIVGNLLENACKWAKRRVRVSGELVRDRLVLVVEDDGPGMSEERARLAVDRGVRFDERHPGSGLGLAIVSDLVHVYEGTLTLSRSELGGVCARVELPPPLPSPAKRGRDHV